MVTQWVQGLTAKPADLNSILVIHMVEGESKLSSPKFSLISSCTSWEHIHTRTYLIYSPKQTINKCNLKVGGEGGGRLRVNLKLQGNMQRSLIIPFLETYLEYKLYLPALGAGHSYIWHNFQLCATPKWLKLMAREQKLRQTGLFFPSTASFL